MPVQKNSVRAKQNMRSASRVESVLQASQQKQQAFTERLDRRRKTTKSVALERLKKSPHIAVLATALHEGKLPEQVAMDRAIQHVQACNHCIQWVASHLVSASHIVNVTQWSDNLLNK